MKNFRALSVMLLAMTGGLTGCFSTTSRVLKTQEPTVFQTASVESVEQQLSERDAAIKTLNAQVQITATTGGGKEGKVKEYTSFTGYIFVQKPANLRVLLKLPLLGSRALDMVSTGDTFTLMHATASQGDKWVQGTNKVTTPSKNGLENLRPAVFLDSLLLPGVPTGEFVTMTETSRVLREDVHHKTEAVEPDYDLSVLHTTRGNVLQVQRVIHINRVTMLPYEQDIYDDDGEVVMQTTYENYQMYGGQQFPALITIRRPLDEYSLKIDVTKLTLNEAFEADRFVLTIPPGTVVQKLQ
jgi:outer membrane lipoprotein-sorting protein